VDAEIFLVDRDVVEQDDAARRQLRKPCLVIVKRRFVRMVPVDVQQVDRMVAEQIQRLVERHAQQRGIAGKLPRGDGEHRLVYRLVEVTGMRIAAPRIDGIATGRKPSVPSRLAEAEKRSAECGAELHDSTRFGETR
jgi:hypothetical protein